MKGDKHLGEDTSAKEVDRAYYAVEDALAPFWDESLGRYSVREFQRAVEELHALGKRRAMTRPKSPTLPGPVVKGIGIVNPKPAPKEGN